MDNTTIETNTSSIKDNHHHGSVGDFLREKIKAGTDLSVVSAFFTIYAYDALKSELENINSLRFLYGDPSSIKSLDPAKISKKQFNFRDEKCFACCARVEKNTMKICVACSTTKHRKEKI